MMPQLWNIITKLEQKAKQKGWRTKNVLLSGSRVLLDIVDSKGRFHRVDALEQAGRVYSEQALKGLSREQRVLRALEQPQPIRWQDLQEYLTHLDEQRVKYPEATGGESYLVLLTTGQVSEDAIAGLLKELEGRLMSLIVLAVEKEGGKVTARGFSSARSVLFDLAGQLLQEEGIELNVDSVAVAGAVTEQEVEPLLPPGPLPKPLRTAGPGRKRSPERVPQLWNVVTGLEQEARRREWLAQREHVSDRRVRLDIDDRKGKFYRVDGLEQGGRVYPEQTLRQNYERKWFLPALEQPQPINWESLKDYLCYLDEQKKAVSGKSHLILLTTGQVPEDTISSLLREPEGRFIFLLLLTAEKEEVRAESLSRLQCDLFDLARKLLEEEGVKVETIPCKHCGQRAVTACHHCHDWLCRSHFMLCPLCKLYFCHHDLRVKSCYFQHKCERKSQE